MKAILKNYRQSPRKVRLVADAIRGKDVAVARRTLQFADKKSSDALLKLLDSALANARNTGHKTDDLFVKEIMVDLSLMLKRGMPMARGRGSIIRHRYSKVTLALGDRTEGKKGIAPKKEVAGDAPKTEKKTATKKVVAKKSSTKKVAAKKTVKKVVKKADK